MRDETTDSGRIHSTTDPKSATNDELKTQLIQTSTEQITGPAIPIKMVWGIFLMTVLMLALVGFVVYSRYVAADAMAERNAELRIELEVARDAINKLRLEQAREQQLSRLSATQEAEGSVLTRMARACPNHRDKVDQVKALTRRYLLLNTDFLTSEKHPSLIIQELCDSYTKQIGESCY